MKTNSLVSTAPRSIGADACGPLSLGCWRLTDPDTSHTLELLEAALEEGMTLIDTADVYGLDFGGSGFGGNEEILGRAFAEKPSLRDNFLVATKGGIAPPVPYDSSRKNLTQACEDSLRRLQIDVIDLYQITSPRLLRPPVRLG